MKDITPPATQAKPAITIDWERYMEPLADWDVDDAVKREFIETLFSLLSSFADLGFNISPVQQACGETIDIGRLLEGGLLHSDPQPTQEFDAAVLYAGVMFKGGE